MGKVRDHIGDDKEALAQWLQRKIRNHDPMSGRDEVKPTRGGKIGFVAQHADDPTKLDYVLRDGRKFRFVVEEVTDEEELPVERRQKATY